MVQIKNKEITKAVNLIAALEKKLAVVAGSIKIAATGSMKLPAVVAGSTKLLAAGSVKLLAVVAGSTKLLAAGTAAAAQTFSTTAAFSSSSAKKIE